MKAEREATRETEAGAGTETIAQALAIRLEGGDDGLTERDLNGEEQAELESLLLMADRLDARMTPRRPSRDFVDSLGRELVQEALRRAKTREKRHRIAVISAAVAGAVVSIASVVGGIVVLVKWLRTRDTQQATAA